MRCKSVMLQFALIICLPFALVGDSNIVIIKIDGDYGIINRGANQGIKEGQAFHVRRRFNNELIAVGKVKVLRVTANRAAIEQTSRQEKKTAQKGDMLFTSSEISRLNLSNLKLKLTSPEKKRVSGNKYPRQETAKPPRRTRKVRSKPRQKSNAKPKSMPQAAVSSKKKYTKSAGNTKNFRLRSPRFIKKPWINANFGLIMPTGTLSKVTSSAPYFNMGYMISVDQNIRVGVEFGSSFAGRGASNLENVRSNSGSASIFSATMLFQRFFGNRFFFEGGAGLYRPKLSMTATDGSKLSYGGNLLFGVFGGAGFYMPTSPFAGFVMKGRIQNYFDKTNRNFFGLTGGFRFKIR